MNVVRRTISLPASLAARLDREARRRGTSFSGLVTALVEGGRDLPPYAGTADDDPDLSLRVEEVLSRLSG